MTLFGPDVSRWQGSVDWQRVDATAAFGWSKCTEGTFYRFEGWPEHKRQMAARAEQTGFLGGAYLFLSEGDGAAQADYFAKFAGDMRNFAIAVDVEPREPNSHPGMATARACVARLRMLYPGHPIVGYIPRWYWQTRDTTFVDALWSSNYVSAINPASPEALYARVSPSQWSGYGGMQVSLLQFTDKALIAGVDGPCDCSAYKGDVDSLRTLLLGAPQKRVDDDMIPTYLPTGTDGHPVAIAGKPKRLRFFSNRPCAVRVSWPGSTAKAVDVHLDYGLGAQGCAVPNGSICAVVNRLTNGETSAGGTAGVGDGTEEISFILVP